MAGVGICWQSNSTCIHAQSPPPPPSLLGKILIGAYCIGDARAQAGDVRVKISIEVLHLLKFLFSLSVDFSMLVKCLLFTLIEMNEAEPSKVHCWMLGWMVLSPDQVSDPGPERFVVYCRS